MTLTAAELQRLKGICQVWRERSLSTKAVDHAKAEKGCREIYAALKLATPAIIWCDSPLIAALTYQLTTAKFDVPTNLNLKTMRSLNKTMETIANSKATPSSDTISLRSLGEDLYGKLISKRLVHSVNEAYGQARVNLDSDTQHRDHFIEHHILNKLFRYFAPTTSLFFPHFITGLSYACLGHLAVLDFWVQHSDLDGMHGLVSAGVHQFIFTETICFLCQAPIKCHVNEHHLLHCDGDAAMEWADGFAIYALNGIAVDKKIAVMPAEVMRPQEMLVAHSGMVLREIIRKIGVERMLPHLSYKILDSTKIYQLLSVDFPDLLADARYLKMINPSTGTYHVEGVTRGADTINKALLERNQGWFTKADKLT